MNRIRILVVENQKCPLLFSTNTVPSQLTPKFKGNLPNKKSKKTPVFNTKIPFVKQKIRKIH